MITRPNNLNPILMCDKCKRPTEHGYLRTEPVETKPARGGIRIVLFYEQLFECSRCLLVRRYGIEGGESDAAVARLRAIHGTFRLSADDIAKTEKVVREGMVRIVKEANESGMQNVDNPGKPIIKVVRDLEEESGAADREVIRALRESVNGTKLKD